MIPPKFPFNFNYVTISIFILDNIHDSQRADANRYVSPSPDAETTFRVKVGGDWGSQVSNEEDDPQKQASFAPCGHLDCSSLQNFDLRPGRSSIILFMT